jgi:hypothetical protein
MKTVKRIKESKQIFFSYVVNSENKDI